MTSTFLYFSNVSGAAPIMRTQGAGVIVNIRSTAGILRPFDVVQFDKRRKSKSKSAAVLPQMESDVRNALGPLLCLNPLWACLTHQKIGKNSLQQSQWGGCQNRKTLRTRVYILPLMRQSL